MCGIVSTMRGSMELSKKPSETVGEVTEVSKQWPQVLALLSASLAMVSAGTLFTWPSPAVPVLLSPQYNITIEEASYLSVIPPLAMIVASPLYCRLLDKIGRKYTLLSCTIFYMTSWFLIAFAKSIYIFYLARMFTGIGDACVFATVPAYIAEVATPKVRGLWGNAMMVLMFMGQFVINALGYYCTIPMTAFIMLSVPILFFVTFVAMPESPYYCVMKKDQEGARKSLQRLRRMKNVDRELKQITDDVERQQSESGNFKDLFTIVSNRRAIIIANLVRAIQQLSGISAIAVYTQYIFMEAGTDISSGHAAMIFSGMLAFVNLFANLLSDYLGRNKSMVFSSLGCGVALLAEAVFFYFQLYTTVDLSNFKWFPIVGMVAYVLVFAIGLGIVPTLLLGEIFSTSIRGQAALTTNVIFAVYLCAINKLFQFLMSSYGLCVPFFFFSMCCFLGAVISYYFVPETKGKTLEEIQQMLKGNKKE